MEEVRWKQRFEYYVDALDCLRETDEAIQLQPQSRINQLAIIQAFEICIELGWKVLKDYLNYGGVEVDTLPKDIVRTAYQYRIIDNGQTWLDMVKDRNVTSHTYREEKAHEIILRIREIYFPALKQLGESLRKKALQ